MTSAQLTTAPSALPADAGVPRDWPGARFSRHVDAGGLRWHVQVQGRGAPILFLHGAGASAHSFRPLVASLAEHYTGIAVDLPGHGFTSAFSHGAYTLRRTARAVGDLISALDVAPALIVGHSAGAAIALQWLLDQPADARPALLALNPALRPFGGVAGFAFPVMARLAAASGSLPRYLARRAADRRQVERLLRGTGSQVPEAMLDSYQYLMRKPEHVQAVLSMMAGWQLEQMVRAVRLLDPAMHVVLGGRDRAVPPARTASTVAGLANTTITELMTLGHLVHEEAPELIADLLLRWRDGAARTRHGQ
ncbi:MAG: alpha/beta fold hydrolase BchO [Pseudomonadota bacterium]